MFDEDESGSLEYSEIMGLLCHMGYKQLEQDVLMGLLYFTVAARGGCAHGSTLLYFMPCDLF